MTSLKEPEEPQEDLETTSTEETPPQTEEEPEVDWSAKGPELQAENEKLNQTIRSERGQRRSNQDRDEELRRIGDVVSANSKFTAQLMSHFSKDDPELATELAKGEETSRQSEAVRSLDSRRDRVRDEIMGIVTKGDSMKVSPEDSQKLVSLWETAQQETYRTGDVSHLYEVKIQAQTAAHEYERKATEAERRKEREEAKTSEKRKLEKAGVYNQDTGAITGGVREDLSATDKIRRGLEERAAKGE